MSLPMLSPELQVVPIFESGPALASTSFNSLSTSSAETVTLNVATRLIRVHAENQGVYLKFAAGVTTSNNGWDVYIGAGQTMDYAVASLNPNPVSIAGRVITVLAKATGGNFYIAEYD